MKNVQHPQLPDCEPYPLKFKDVPVTNGDGQGLRRCKACNGSGSVCKGEKVDPKTSPTPPHVVYIHCTGSDRSSYQRKGYTLTCERCSACSGAGLVVEGAR